jgi:Ala-tRNA(Pro) deacylase
MAASMKIKDLLEKEKIGYQLLEHETAYTAMEIAGSQHVPGRQFVKSVIVNADGKFLMCVLPAIHKVDFEKLKKATGAKEIHLAEEKEFADLFPDYEVGAEPPFGQFYGLKVYVDKILDENEEIVFNAGTHTDLIKIKFRDFLRLANPTIVDFGVHV